MAKMFEDAFRTLGILEDDDPAHVKRSILEVTTIPREKGSKTFGPAGKKGNAQDQDFVEITINSI